MEASVLPKVTVDLPTVPVSLVTKWKHLSDLEFRDPDYETWAQVDILLGGKVFRKAVLHGRWFGPTGAPSALKTCFSWVLNGEVKGKGRLSSAHSCYAAVGNNVLRRMSNSILPPGTNIKRWENVRFWVVECWHQNPRLQVFPIIIN